MSDNYDEEWLRTLETSFQSAVHKQQKSVFISYRTQDTAWAAGRIYDWLKRNLAGRVFLDVEIKPGQDFRDVLEKTVKSSNVFLIVIGERWLSELQARSEDVEDWVRWELEIALLENIPIIPLLVDNVEMPKAVELPGSISELSWRNPSRLRHREFEIQMANFIQFLKNSYDL